MSKKDIAFLFYPNDWLGGTQGFSFEHKGAYMELMIFQFNNGPMTVQDIKDILGPYFDSMWERKLKAKFIFEDGKYFNKRVAESKTKRENYSQSRKNNLHGHKFKAEEVKSTEMITPMVSGIIDQYFIDLPNSTLFEDTLKVLKKVYPSMDPDQLKTFIDPFRTKAELEYPNFVRFVTHFKNYVSKELKDSNNGQSNSKGKQRATYNAEGLTNLNNAINERKDQS